MKAMARIFLAMRVGVWRPEFDGGLPTADGRRPLFFPPRGGPRSAVGRRLPQPPEAPLAPAETGDGPGEHLAGDVGPAFLQEEELGVGALPEEEVAEPLLAGRADQEVHRRRADGVVEGGGEVALEGRARGRRVGRPGLGGPAAGGLAERVTRRVVHGEAEVEALAVARLP